MMKDLVDKILKFLPQYFLLLAALFTGPKSYFRSIKFKRDDAFTTAALFVAASLVIVQIAQLLSVAAGTDPWNFVAGQALFWLAYIVIGGGIVFLIWRLVGGRAPPRTMFIIYAYCLAVTSIIGVAFQTLAAGIMRTYEPDRYGEVIKAIKGHTAYAPGLFEPPAMQIAGFVFLAGIVVGLVWMFIAWGAFRAVNKTGKAASGAAFVLALVLTLPALFLLTLINNALF